MKKETHILNVVNVPRKDKEEMKADLALLDGHKYHATADINERLLGIITREMSSASQSIREIYDAKDHETINNIEMEYHDET